MILEKPEAKSPPGTRIVWGVRGSSKKKKHCDHDEDEDGTNDETTGAADDAGVCNHCMKSKVEGDISWNRRKSNLRLLFQSSNLRQKPK